MKKIIVLGLIALSVISLSTNAFAGAIQLPQTGQTTSYAAGDDGALQMGVAWPNPRFVDNADGTVTDNLTGLMWTKDANPAGNDISSWQQALDYVKTLNTGGHTDWRLPNINELKSLVDYSQSKPALPLGHPFTNVQSDYWSSTTYADYPYDAWIVNFDYGGMSYYNKSYSSSYVRAVRGGQCGPLGNSVICLPKTGQTICYDSDAYQFHQIPCAGTGQDGDIQAGVAWPSSRFTDNADGTVTDNLTGLMWTKDANPAGNYMTWQQALDYVKTLNTGGHTDWRLPNFNEQESLVDYSQYSPALPLGHPFTNVQFYNYWSSTAHGPGGAWEVNMYDGDVNSNAKSDYYVGDAWSVRSGGSSGTSTILTTTTTIQPTATTVIPTSTTTIPHNSTTTIPISTTTTVPANQCVAETIYGEHSEETELLREYRDKVLSKSATGRQMIKTYYEASPAVAEFLQQNETARASARRVLDSLMPAIRKKVNQ